MQALQTETRRRQRKLVVCECRASENETFAACGPAFDLAGTTDTTGAPLFAFFAKGGHDAARSADFDSFRHSTGAGPASISFYLADIGCPSFRSFRTGALGSQNRNRDRKIHT
jgi:hypothetical protein